MARLPEKFEIEVHTTVKEIDMKKLNLQTNEEIIGALKKVMDIPNHIQSLTLILDLNNSPIITYTTIVEKPKEN